VPFIVAELGRDADPFMLHLYAAREKERWLSCEEGARRKARYSRNIVDAGVRIPTEAGRVFRREAGQGSGLKPATIPI
jgi:hypothetical protein